jgi:hypothetical protein
MIYYRVFYKYQDINYRLYFKTEEFQTDYNLITVALEEIRKFHKGVDEKDISRLERRVRR